MDQDVETLLNFLSFFYIQCILDNSIENLLTQISKWKHIRSIFPKIRALISLITLRRVVVLVVYLVAVLVVVLDVVTL